jgi:hypothetical protein
MKTAIIKRLKNTLANNFIASHSTKKEAKKKIDSFFEREKTAPVKGGPMAVFF